MQHGEDFDLCSTVPLPDLLVGCGVQARTGSVSQIQSLLSSLQDHPGPPGAQCSVGHSTEVRLVSPVGGLGHRAVLEIFRISEVETGLHFLGPRRVNTLREEAG